MSQRLSRTKKQKSDMLRFDSLSLLSAFFFNSILYLSRVCVMQMEMVGVWSTWFIKRTHSLLVLIIIKLIILRFCHDIMHYEHIGLLHYVCVWPFFVPSMWSTVAQLVIDHDGNFTSRNAVRIMQNHLTIALQVSNQANHRLYVV